jgi:hypothetical protein
MGGRLKRSASGGSSNGSESVYSHGTSSVMITDGVKTGRLEREVKNLLEDVKSTTLDGQLRGLSKSKSTGRQRSFATESVDNAGTKSASGKGSAVPSIAHRSNTMQGAYASEGRASKLPTRARTSREKHTEAGREKERVKKLRVCLKCDRKIEDGRWIQIDGGGVLCEHCWKNMYLPKVGFRHLVSLKGLTIYLCSVVAVTCPLRNKPYHLQMAN